MSFTEKHFHNVLREYRIPGGEWFNLGLVAAHSEDLTSLLDEVAVSISEKVAGKYGPAPNQGLYSEDFCTDVAAA